MVVGLDGAWARPEPLPLPRTQEVGSGIITREPDVAAFAAMR